MAQAPQYPTYLTALCTPRARRKRHMRMYNSVARAAFGPGFTKLLNRVI